MTVKLTSPFDLPIMIKSCSPGDQTINTLEEGEFRCVANMAGALTLALGRELLMLKSVLLSGAVAFRFEIIQLSAL